MLLSIAGEAVLSACERACSLIDMNAHEGTHPCMGAVDLVPIYPLGEEVGLEDCGKEAQGMWSCMHRRKVKMYSQNAFSLFFLFKYECVMFLSICTSTAVFFLL